MSLVSNLMQSGMNSVIDTSDIQIDQNSVHEGFLDDAIVELCQGIYAVNEAYLTADIIGSCKVVTEGADPEVLLESMISSGIEKLKGVWRKFLAAIRAFFDKVVTLFKSLILSNTKFTKEFGPKLIEKAKTAKDFKYKGYEYAMTAGDNKVKSAQSAISAKIETMIGKIADAASTNTEDLLGKLNLAKKDSNMTPADIAEAVVKSIDSSCENSSDLKDAIIKAYRGDADSPSEQTLSGVAGVKAMISFIEKAGDIISSVKKDRDDFEKKVSAIIKKLDVLGGKKGETKKEQTAYSNASKISSFLTALMNLYKVPCNAKIAAYKEVNRKYNGVLKMFLNFGKVSEGALFEGDDEFDPEDMADVELDEAAIAGADEPEGDTNDIGIVKEGCGKKCATEEGCSSDKDPLEEAMMYL